MKGYVFDVADDVGHICVRRAGPDGGAIAPEEMKELCGRLNEWMNNGLIALQDTTALLEKTLSKMAKPGNERATERLRDGLQAAILDMHREWYGDQPCNS